MKRKIFVFILLFISIFTIKNVYAETYNGEYSVESAIAMVELEIEQAKREGIVALKVLHGYGSHGRGGAIMLQLRKVLLMWKAWLTSIEYCWKCSLLGI